MRKIVSKFHDLSIRTKLTVLFLLITVIIFFINILIYLKVNHTIYDINKVYASNVDTNKLNDTLTNMQSYVYDYLSTRSTNALENYYRSEAEYSDLIEELNDSIMDNEILILERNIRHMSSNYIKRVEETIQEKRGGNIEKYKMLYEEALELQQYISNSINSLNNMHFKQNSEQYTLLLGQLQRIELISFGILICSAVFSLIFMYMLTGNLIAPLMQLAESADKVAGGDFHVQLTIPSGKNEISSVAVAFNSMIISIRAYIRQIRENMEKEKKMQERELLMETHLKDAQLKYLQAQINPHFLFNSLNAGAQLATMEDAEKTCLFIERMADFFRYNVRKMEEETTLGEEVEAVDNYIYIMNVRYQGEIHYERKVKKELFSIKVPSMILQPLVENALNYGIHDIDWNGYIILEVFFQKETLFIRVKDNGQGMTKKRIEEVLNGKAKEKTHTGYTTGIGIDNVKSRLELYYKQENLLNIESEGVGKGTSVIIQIPNIYGGEENVSNFTGR